MDYDLVYEDNNQGGSINADGINSADPLTRITSGFVEPLSMNFHAPKWSAIRSVNAKILLNNHDDYVEFHNLNLGQCDVVVSQTDPWDEPAFTTVATTVAFEDSGLVKCKGLYDSIGYQDEPFRYLLGKIRGVHADCKPLGRMFYVQFSRRGDFLMIRYNKIAFFRGKRVIMKDDEVFNTRAHGDCFATVDIEFFFPKCMLLARLRAVQLVLLSFDVIWNPDADQYQVSFRGTAYTQAVKAALSYTVKNIYKSPRLKEFYGSIPHEAALSLVDDISS